MSAAIELSDQLRAGGTGAVVALLRARPDLSYPVPADLIDLAARALSVGSTSWALAKLDASRLRVLAGLVAGVEPDEASEVGTAGTAEMTETARMAGTAEMTRTEEMPGAAEDSDLPDGDSTIPVEELLAELASMALVIGSPPAPTPAVRKILARPDGASRPAPRRVAAGRTKAPEPLDDQTLASIAAWLVGDLAADDWRGVLGQAAEQDLWVQLAHAREDGTLAIDLVRVLLIAHGSAYMVRRAGRRLNVPLNRVVAARLTEPVVINDHSGLT